MHGEDTSPYGYEPAHAGRESAELNLIAGRTEASRFEAWRRAASEVASQHDPLMGEPVSDWHTVRRPADPQARRGDSEADAEPDWQALRARAQATAESALQAQPTFQPKRIARMELERAAEQCVAANAELRAAEEQYQYAESDDAAELAAQRYERAHARLSEAEDQLESAQHAATETANAPKSKPARTTLPYAIAAEAAPALPMDPITAVLANPSFAPPARNLQVAPSWETSGFEASPAQGGQWLPKLFSLVAIVALGAGGFAFSQHRAAEAERTARAEKLLQEMHAADAVRDEAERASKAVQAQAALAAEAARKALTTAPVAATAPAPGSARHGGGAPSGKAERATPRSKRQIASSRKRRLTRQAKARKVKPSSSAAGDANDPLFGL